MNEYRRLQEITGELFSILGPREAHRHLDIARVLAYDPVRDAGLLVRALSELGDSLQSQDLAPPGAAMSQALSRVIGAMPPTTFIYINGVNTDPSEANTTISHYLEPVLAEAGYPDRTLYPVRRSYNVSANLIPNGSTWNCLLQQALAAAVGQWSAAQQIAQCFGSVTDLAQSARQVVGQALLALPPTRDVDHLVQVIRAVIGGGSRAVLVAHSQGNLVVGDALQVLAQATPTTRLECIGVVSIAPPRLIQQGATGATVNSLIVRGAMSRDILLWFGMANGVPTVPNALSDAWDLSPPAGLIEQLVSGLDLHAINTSYLSMVGTRDSIIRDLRTQVSLVAQRCPDPAPPAVAITSPIVNGELPVGGGNVDVAIPVTVSLLQGPLLGPEPVVAALFLSAKEPFYRTAMQVWASGASDFPPATLNSSGSKTITARFRFPGTLSPTAFYSLYGQLTRNGAPLAQAQSPIVGVVTVFSYPLDRLPLSFPADAVHPAGVLPLTESILANYGGRVVSGVTTGARQSSIGFRLGAANTIQAIYDFYEAYLSQRGFRITWRSLGAQMGSLYGVLPGNDPFTGTDCNFAVSMQAGSPIVQIAFVTRYRY
jgi:hypothetical protein